MSQGPIKASDLLNATSFKWNIKPGSLYFLFPYKWFFSRNIEANTKTDASILGKTTAVRRRAIPETSGSRHHRGTIESLPKNLRTSEHHHIEGFKGALLPGPLLCQNKWFQFGDAWDYFRYAWGAETLAAITVDFSVRDFQNYWWNFISFFSKYII